MSGSTSTPSFQIEDLLHSYGEVLAAKRAQETPTRKASSFDGRSLMAGFLAVFVFAPGCAAATAFLLKSEDRVPLIDPPSASKSNRMPLAQWKARPAVATDQATSAPTAVDVSFLGPVAIRGRLDAEIAAVAAEPSAPEPTVITPRPRRKTDIRRATVSVVAEAAVSESEPPSLLEKLFALRNL